MKTLKQVSELFNEFATTHDEINYYNCEHINNITTNNITFPIMWAMPMPSQVKSLSFDIYFLDLLAQDRTNFIDALSEMNTIMYDFVKYLEDNIYLEFTDQFSFDIAEGKFDDHTIGINLSITINYINPQNC